MSTMETTSKLLSGIGSSIRDIMNLKSIVTLRCPVCGKGKIFKSLLDTPEQCPECKYFFMRESGYYLPHFAIAYLATGAAALGVWPLLSFLGVTSDAVILASMIL